MSGHTIVWLLSSGAVEPEVTCHEPRGAECHQGDEDLTEVDIYPECNPILWIEDGDGWIEHYEGPRVPLVNGPIQFEWDGDNWTWKYAEATR